MKAYERVLCFLQGRMEEPVPWGWFHIMWILFIVAALTVLLILKKKQSEKQLKWVLGIYGITAFVLELTKQIIWSFEYDAATQVATWDYQWYAAPFQLCTTPLFVTIICLFLKNNKLRDALLSYMAYFTILGSIATILIPTDCFTSYIEVNVHTMWLHYGSFVVSIYLMVSGVVKANKRSFIGAILTFMSFATLANIINVLVYHSGWLKGETFNMFYISPYFVSSLPVFDVIQESVPYLLYLLIYLVALSMGAGLIYVIHRLTRKRVIA